MKVELLGRNGNKSYLLSFKFYYDGANDNPSSNDYIDIVGFGASIRQIDEKKQSPFQVNGFKIEQIPGDTQIMNGYFSFMQHLGGKDGASRRGHFGRIKCLKGIEFDGDGPKVGNVGIHGDIAIITM